MVNKMDRKRKSSHHAPAPKASGSENIAVGSNAAPLDAQTVGEMEADTVDLNPVVLMCPGLKPDVRLRVFHREFHVHSVLLKMHSTFFRTCFESLEQNQHHSRSDNMAEGSTSQVKHSSKEQHRERMESSHDFKYSLVTKVIDNTAKIWRLVPSHKVPMPFNCSLATKHTQ